MFLLTTAHYIHHRDDNQKMMVILQPGGKRGWHDHYSYGEIRMSSVPMSRSVMVKAPNHVDLFSDYGESIDIFTRAKFRCRRHRT